MQDAAVGSEANEPARSVARQVRIRALLLRHPERKKSQLHRPMIADSNSGANIIEPKFAGVRASAYTDGSSICNRRAGSVVKMVGEVLEKARRRRKLNL